MHFDVVPLLLAIDGLRLIASGQRDDWSNAHIPTAAPSRPSDLTPLHRSTSCESVHLEI